MKILFHTLVALALTLTLVSGLCVGCVQTGSEHKCCRHTKQAPSCHQPRPSERERCDCPDTGRIMAAALEVKQTGKQISQPLAVLTLADVPAETPELLPGVSPSVRALDLPPPDLLVLNHILRI